VVITPDFDGPEEQSIRSIVNDETGKTERSKRIQDQKRTAGLAKKRTMISAGGTQRFSRFAGRAGSAFATTAKVNVINRILSAMPPEVSSAIQGASLVGDFADVIPVVGRPLGMAIGAAGGAGMEVARREMQEIQDQNMARISSRGIRAFRTGGANIRDARMIAEATFDNFKEAITDIDLTDPDGSIERIRTALGDLNDLIRTGQGGMAALSAYTESIALGRSMDMAESDAERAFYRAQPNVLPAKVVQEMTNMHGRQKFELVNRPTELPVIGD